MTTGCRILALLLLPALVAVASVVPGSWSAHVTGPRVAGPGRMYSSRALLSPVQVPSAARLLRVRWRVDIPPAARLAMWLCAGSHCVPVKGRSGMTEALAGRDARLSLSLRFRLPKGDVRAVQVGVIQLMAEYR